MKEKNENNKKDVNQQKTSLHKKPLFFKERKRRVTKAEFFKDTTKEVIAIAFRKMEENLSRKYNTIEADGKNGMMFDLDL